MSNTIWFINRLCAKRPLPYPAQIREFADAMGEARVELGYFVTTSGFSKMAQEAAANSNVVIHLIDGQKLGRLQNRVRGQAEADVRLALLPFKWGVQFATWQKVVILALLTAR